MGQDGGIMSAHALRDLTKLHADNCGCLACYALAMTVFVEHVRDGFDCDVDAHRYNTLCRCCGADAALRGANPFAVDLRPL